MGAIYSWPRVTILITTVAHRYHTIVHNATAMVSEFTPNFQSEAAASRITELRQGHPPSPLRPHQARATILPHPREAR